MRDIHHQQALLADKEAKDSHYQALYVSDYFIAKAAEQKQSKRRKVLSATKGALKQTTALLCLLFPSLFRRNRRTSQSKQVYTSLFDKAHRQAKRFAEDKARLKPRHEGSQEEFKLEELAELIVTLDPYTTGFM